MERKRSLDWMCIGIEKIAESATDAQYAFVANVYEPDPQVGHKSRIVGQNRGVLKVAKATGEVTLVEAMPEDTDSKRFISAAHRVRQHWAAKEYPDKTMFACG